MSTNESITTTMPGTTTNTTTTTTSTLTNSPKKGHCHRQKVEFRASYGTATLHEFSGCSSIPQGTSIILGFPSLTVTPVLTTGFLIDQLKLPLIGVISSPELSPKCLIEQSQPSHPIRIHGDHRCIVFSSESKIPSNILTSNIVEAILDFAYRHKAAMILTVEGFPTEGIEREPGRYEKLQFLSSSERVNGILEGKGLIGVGEGVIAGVTGLLFSQGLIRDQGPDGHWVDIGLLLAPCAVGYPDARSVVSLVKILAELLPEAGNIDVKSLEVRASKLEAGVSSFLESEATAQQHALHMYG